MAIGISASALNDVGFIPTDPEFSQLTADTLGDNLTDGDGWEDEMQKLIGFFDGGDDLLKDMSSKLDPADFVDGQFHSDNIVPFINDTGQFLSDGGPIFDAMNDAIAGGGGPPPPPDGGGGGGGGGGDICPPGPCQDDSCCQGGELCIDGQCQQPIAE